MRPRKFGLRVYEPGATEGFTLYSPSWRPKTFLLNMKGEVVHEWDLPGHPGGYAYLLPNGNLFYAAATDSGPPFKGGASGGLMREVDWNGNVILEYQDDWQHHDCRRLNNGNILYAGWEIMPEEAAKRVQGGIPGTELPEGMINDFVREVTPEGEMVWEWHTYEMDIEAYPLHPLASRRVWAWMNSCFPLDTGDVLISLRQINTIAIIDYRTKAIKWVRRDDSWGHQHDCQMLNNGNIMLFANGMNTAAPHAHSYVIEFNPETNETVWRIAITRLLFFTLITSAAVSVLNLEIHLYARVPLDVSSKSRSVGRLYGSSLIHILTQCSRATRLIGFLGRSDMLQIRQKLANVCKLVIFPPLCS